MNEDRLDVPREPHLESVQYQMVPTSKRESWLFQLGVVVTAYLTVAACGLIFKFGEWPLLDAIPPAIGVMIGFIILNLIAWRKRRATK